jgi:hypothetical protein
MIFDFINSLFRKFIADRQQICEGKGETIDLDRVASEPAKKKRIKTFARKMKDKVNKKRKKRKLRATKLARESMNNRVIIHHNELYNHLVQDTNDDDYYYRKNACVLKRKGY